MLDPWGYSGVRMALGLPQYHRQGAYKAGAHVVWINGSAHHLDLWSPNEADLLSIRDMREETLATITHWLAEPL